MGTGTNAIEWLRARWKHGRAALLTLALIAHGLEACPSPHVTPAHLAKPMNQRQLRRWSGWLDVPPDALARHVLAGSDALARWRNVVTTPARPWFALTQTHQQWKLFPIADPEPYWIVIETAGRDGRFTPAWRPLRHPGPVHLPAPLPRQLEQRRVRAVWNPGTLGPRAGYAAWVDWLAREIFRRDDDVHAVRVSVDRITLRPATMAPAPIPATSFAARLFPEVRHRHMMAIHEEAAR